MKEKLLNEKSRYLLGLSGQNILYALICSCFAYYLQFTLLIPPLWLGVILSVGKIFDAVKDPFIGVYISKSKTNEKKLLYTLPLPTAILTVLCFTQSIYSQENGTLQNSFIIIYSFIIFLLWETVFSFGDIPMVSLPNAISKNEDERKQLFALRNVGAMVCSICCLITQPLAFSLSSKLGDSANDERNAFLIVAVIFSFIGFMLYKLTVKKDSSKLQPEMSEKNDKPLYKYIFTNPLLKKIILSGLLFSMTSLQGVILPALVSYYFSTKSSALTLLYTFLLGTGSFTGMALSAIFVPRISKKFSNIKAYVFCNLSSALPLILIFLLYMKNKTSMTSFIPFAAMFILMLISGSLLAFSSSMRTLLIDDALELEYKISGNKPTSMFFSFVTAIIKINSGISSLIASLGYTLIGFTSEDTAKLNEYIANGFTPRDGGEYSSLFTMLFFMFTVLPAVSAVLSVLPFARYRE